MNFITTKAFFQHRFLLFILLLFLRQWWKGKPDRTKVEQKEKIRKRKTLLHYLDFTGLIIETSITVIHNISFKNNTTVPSLQKALNCCSEQERSRTVSLLWVQAQPQTTCGFRQVPYSSLCPRFLICRWR